MKLTIEIRALNGALPYDNRIASNLKSTRKLTF